MGNGGEVDQKTKEHTGMCFAYVSPGQQFIFNNTKDTCAGAESKMHG